MRAMMIRIGDAVYCLEVGTPRCIETLTVDLFSSFTSSFHPLFRCSVRSMFEQCTEKESFPSIDYEI